MGLRLVKVMFSEVLDPFTAEPLGVAGFLRTMPGLAVDTDPVPDAFLAEILKLYVAGNAEIPVTVNEVAVDAVCEIAFQTPLLLIEYSIT